MKLKIGIFDSGIGGFTILSTLMKTRNDIEVFYLADTKRVPYGNKNIEQIRFIAMDICNWFKDKNLDALLIACNTTNACALDILENNLEIPCFDLVNSVSEIVTKKNIGVLATPATIKTSYYKKIIESKRKNIKVFQQACPQFVPEIEKTNIDLNQLNYLSDLYLNPLLKENIEEIILGCSHYPLIYNVLRNKIDPKISIIDPSASLVNNFNNSFLIPKNYSYEATSNQNIKFFVTEKTEDFSRKVKYWLEINKEIRLVNLRSND
ncbi:glutamate racemase [Prochlorococcus sp. AH-716-O05]|nr:glutamate racemase [Prochlorococcus sp. AH-716-O05]